jgi:hypothetical protein
LKPGRKYEDAVNAFQPYDSTKDINYDARKAGASLIEEGKQNSRRKTFIYVNNRLEEMRLPPLRQCWRYPRPDNRLIIAW